VRNLSGVAIALMAVVVTAQSSRAADLPVAPGSSNPGALLYQWSGFYFGLNGGGAWSQATDTSTGTFTQNFLFTGSGKHTAPVAGGQFGFNIALGPNWVIGAEGDFDWTKTNLTVVSPDVTNNIVDKVETFATARARFGYALNNWLIYATGGGAWSTGRAVRNQVIGIFGSAGPSTIEDSSNGHFGWAAGGGLEWGVWRDWTLRAEYLYLGLGRVNYKFPLAAVTTGASLNMQVARVGLNYKFTWGAPVYVQQ
jgi:outer membrane immunogenic protein